VLVVAGCVPSLLSVELLVDWFRGFPRFRRVIKGIKQKVAPKQQDQEEAKSKMKHKTSLSICRSPLL